MPADYARSTLLALTPMLDRVEQRIPLPPAQVVWNGGAKTQYEMELARLRDLVTLLRTHQQQLVDSLAAVSSCG